MANRPKRVNLGCFKVREDVLTGYKATMNTLELDKSKSIENFMLHIIQTGGNDLYEQYGIKRKLEGEHIIDVAQRNRIIQEAINRDKIRGDLEALLQPSITFRGRHLPEPGRLAYIKKDLAKKYRISEEQIQITMIETIGVIYHDPMEREEVLDNLEVQYDL